MRYLILIALLVMSGLVFALNIDQCQTLNNQVSVKLTDVRNAPVDVTTAPGEAVDAANSVLSAQTYALPYETAQVQVQSMNWKIFNARGTYLRSENTIDQSAVYLSNSFNFREMRGFTVAMKNQIQSGSEYKVLSRVEYTLTGQSAIQLPTGVSAAFTTAYKKLAANYETSYLRNLPISRPKMLIISHTNMASYIVDFVKWKRQKGFEVYVVNTAETGTSTIAIRDYIQTHYLQYQCDYLLLMGDSSGSFAIPTNSYTSPDGLEDDADDNFYTFLAGDDYFPEMLVGRYSFADISEFQTMANKTINYEKAPSMTTNPWMRKALVVAGNYAEGGLQPSTPVQMSRWLREKLLAKGYTQVDTVFYPPTYYGSGAISAAINQGVQFISYRGWGDANGWHYPYFHIPELAATNCGPRLPVVFSIVCNTGDFVNSVNPCFGEKWMRMGSPSVPNGAVAFVGPSDLHTKTNLNNTISTGAYSSIFDDGERSFGASILAGKMELYNNYPLEHAHNQLVAFYFHVYNILSDPSLNMWVLVPETIPPSVVPTGTTFAQSDSHISIASLSLNDAMVTGTKNGIDFTYATVHDGVAVLPINPDQTGNLTLTISKPNNVPLVSTLTPAEPATVGVSANSLEGDLIFAGQTYPVALTIKNYSTAALSNIAANMTVSPAGSVVIANPNQTIASLAAGATSVLTFNATVAGNVAAHEIIRFSLNFPAQSTQAAFEQMTGGAEFTVLNATGNLAIGQSNSVTFSLKNTGSFALSGGSATVYSNTNAATVTSAAVTLGNVAIDGTVNVQTTINVQSSCFDGRNIPLQFTITNPAGYRTVCYYNLTAGTPTAADPTGPDGYGYYAYDSFDVSYPAHPTYQWVEIDPGSGGSGSVHEIMDDGSYNVNLPFSFKYYGQEYDSMTICSNGWVSFVTTWMSDFNNLFIPAALGPYAMAAPYWDDLKGLKTGETTFNNMRICNWYDAANNRYIVEWNNAYNNYTIDEMENASLEKFQVILYPGTGGADGNLVYQYHTIDNPAVTSNYCTVGIENHLQNDGLTYTFCNSYPATATTLQAGLAVKFTTSPPDTFVGNDDALNSDLPFVLGQNQPNPFNPQTTISYSVTKAAELNLCIYNTKGQLIRTLQAGLAAKGNHSVVWNGKDDQGKPVGNGIYLYKMQSGSTTQIRKMMLLK